MLIFPIASGMDDGLVMSKFSLSLFLSRLCKQERKTIFHLSFCKMNKSFRRPAFSLIFLFPLTLIVLMLVFFGYYSAHYSWIKDDWTFHDQLMNAGIFDTSISFYETGNGRLASHFFLCSVIKLFTGFESLLFVYRFIMLLGFIISLAHLIKNYLSAFRQKTISLSRSFFFSAFITAFLFFFFYNGKIELWFWVSSTGVYLISLILAMNGFALLFSEKQTPANITLSAFLFFLAGGFSESYAIMYLLVLVCFSYKIIRRDPFFAKRKMMIASALIAISAGLLINIFSGGAHARLAQLKNFGFIYPFVNTLHSLAFPILQYQSLWIKIIITSGLLRYASINFPTHFDVNEFGKRAKVVILFITLSFFIPAFILSDIVPDRAASLGYLAGTLFLFDYFIFSAADFADLR